jgi:U3 small nucleolar RNA-associated protein 10
MDTTNFISECAEDDHDDVAKAARAFRRTVEAVSGSLANVLD